MPDVDEANSLVDSLVERLHKCCMNPTGLGWCSIFYAAFSYASLIAALIPALMAGCLIAVGRDWGGGWFRQCFL